MRDLLTRLWKWICDGIYDAKCALYRKFSGGKAKSIVNVKTQKRKDYVFYVCMMAIPVIQFCVMFIGVNWNAIMLAFQEYDADMNATWTLNNFKMVVDNFLHDQELRLSVRNSALFYILTTAISLPTSLFISFYFYKKWKHADVLKLILFIPGMISGVVTVTCFYYLADRGWPLLVEFFTGRTDELGLLVNSNTRLPVLIAYNIFYSLSGSFLFYSSAMSGIDPSISEAAQIDGASMLQEFTRITLPNIFPLLSTFILSGLAGSLIGDYGMYAFSQTGGSSVPTMGYYFTLYVTQDGAERRYPYFSALGICLTIVTCIIVFSARALLNRMDPFHEEPEKKRRAQ